MWIQWIQWLGFVGKSAHSKNHGTFTTKMCWDFQFLFFPQRTCAILGKSFHLQKWALAGAWVFLSLGRPGFRAPFSILVGLHPRQLHLEMVLPKTCKTWRVEDGNGLPLKKGQPVLWWINRIFLWTFWPCEMIFRSSSQEHPVRMQTWKARNPWFLVSAVIVMVAEGRVDGLKLSFPRYVCSFPTIYPPVSNRVTDPPLTSTCWFSPSKIGINQLLPFR